MRLLIAEDNRALSDLIVPFLARSGFAADVAASAGEAEASLAAVDYAGMVLDLGLPDEDGISLLRRLRLRRHPIPVLVLTARDGLTDRVEGLRAGADDYLMKPFALEELLERVRAVLRRPQVLLPQILSCGNLTLDPAANAARVDGAELTLSLQEAQLLTILARSVGRVVSKRHLESQLFGLGDAGGANAVEVAMHRLRRRLEAGGATAVIVTVRGLGYFLAAQA